MGVFGDPLSGKRAHAIPPRGTGNIIKRARHHGNCIQTSRPVRNEQPPKSGEATTSRDRRSVPPSGSICQHVRWTMCPRGQILRTCLSHKNLSVGVYAAAPGTTSDVRAPPCATQNTLVSSRRRKFERCPKTISSPTALIPPVQRSQLKRSDQLMGTSVWTSSCFICREALKCCFGLVNSCLV